MSTSLSNLKLASNVGGGAAADESPRHVVAETAKSVRNRKPGIMKDGWIPEGDAVIDRDGVPVPVLILMPRYL